jgi:starch synthase (maltosyl-transferring)
MLGPASAEMQRSFNQRIRFTRVRPAVDDGRYLAKGVLDEWLKVQATIFCDGTESLGAAVCYRHESEKSYSQTSLRLLGNDAWEGKFQLSKLGRWYFEAIAWTDSLATWQVKLQRKWNADDRDLHLDFQDGAEELRALAKRIPADGRAELLQAAILLDDRNQAAEEIIEVALKPEWAALSEQYPDPDQIVRGGKLYPIVVEPQRAAFAAWYELFPRSQAEKEGQHGTFRDVLQRLPEWHDLGFDVLYFPPIHPIGLTNRKGKNNFAAAEADDVGSPWAIGNYHGGHDAIEPALGSLDDFRMLVQAAQAHNMEIALDLALNCSPDHPWVAEHPDWFQRRSDGSIAYAENPPKKYQDVYPLDFENPDWPSLWREVLRIVSFWIDQGVKTFRVDNPHTKPVGFWEWLIRSIKGHHPEVIFLSEAFTRPAMMKELAKIGFSQSYTYFTWRNTKQELTEYLTELTTTEMVEYFRPNFFANTPDILHAYLQEGGKGAFSVRLFLAATLSPLYGLYSGFEFYENQPFHEGSEEYLHSEKYELKHRPRDQAGGLKPLIQLLNQTRHSHPALQRLTGLQFHEVNNSQLLCYSKSTPDHSDVILCVVNLDPHHPQDGMVTMDWGQVGMHDCEQCLVHDLVSDQTWTWKQGQNYVRLEPQTTPAHLFTVQRLKKVEAGQSDGSAAHTPPKKETSGLI